MPLATCLRTTRRAPVSSCMAESAPFSAVYGSELLPAGSFAVSVANHLRRRGPLAFVADAHGAHVLVGEHHVGEVILGRIFLAVELQRLLAVHPQPLPGCRHRMRQCLRILERRLDRQLLAVRTHGDALYEMHRVAVRGPVQLAAPGLGIAQLASAVVT